MTPKLPASCHCGAVRLEIARKPRTLTDCNCSICRRYGVLWAYYSRRSVRIRGASAVYKRGSRTIEFHHCTTCGCVTHYEQVKKKGPDTRIAVNARMMRPEDVASIRVKRLDGAKTWKVMGEYRLTSPNPRSRS